MNFFFKLINSTKKFLDVYLEAGYDPTSPNLRDKIIQLKNLRHKPDNELQGYMNKTMKILSQLNCGINILEGDQNKKCIYKNIRFHSTDIRDIESYHLGFHIGFMSNFLLYCLLSNNNESEICQNYFDTLYKVNLLHDYFTDQEKINLAIKEFFKVSKIEKQIVNIKYPDVKYFLLNKYKGILSKSHLINFDYIYNEIILSDEVEYEKIFEVVYYMCEFMDIFLMARMFRSFKNIEGVYSEDPKNIIIYVGNYHAQQYYQWLKKLGFTTLYQNEKAYDVKYFVKYVEIANCIKVNFIPGFLD